MWAVDLCAEWGPKHQEAFINLKAAPIAEPVLKDPVFDGCPFIVMTDGSKEGFGAMLCQRFETTLPKGKVVSCIHPIAFAFKCTSLAEEQYKPYLLKFATLKYALDKFSETIYGFPVEIETDCQALQDTVMNANLNTTHGRWLKMVMEYNIQAIRHLPGAVNFVGDTLSRKYTNLPRRVGDGSEWTVQVDLFINTGLAFDLYTVLATPDEMEILKKCFADIPVFG